MTTPIKITIAATKGEWMMAACAVVLLTAAVILFMAPSARMCV